CQNALELLDAQRTNNVGPVAEHIAYRSPIAERSRSALAKKLASTPWHGTRVRDVDHHVNERLELETRGIWHSHLLPRCRALIGLLRAAWQEYQRDYAKYLALAMVYYALVSLIPLLLLVLATLGLLLRASTVAAAAEQRILYSVQTGFGAEMAATL